MERIRVMLADDEEAVLGLMVDVMASDPAIDLVGTARDADEAIALARTETPDVALVDVRMPGGGGGKVARDLRRESPGTRVVAVSAHTDPDVVVAMLREGAVGYVAKDETPDQLLRAVYRTAEGRTSISVESLGDVAERLAGYLSHRTDAALQHTSQRIMRAINGPSLHMVFQPIVELRGGHVVGVEALARFMERPRRLPEAWFAAAASVGLLVELELAAVGRGLAEIDQLPLGTYLSVNVSPETIRASGLPSLLEDPYADRIVLEMTEQSAVTDYDELAQCLRPIRERGVRFAIDDFGAGFASLNHVVQLAPDFMKLDRTLIVDVATDPVRHSLIERLLSFADEAGIAAIAEGVEKEDDLAELRSLGVPYGQGFLLGRPGPIPNGQDVWPIRWPGRHAFRTAAS
jgi:EAL domain-containing protein (putative c-di-GMP-specific phosphodiesterase class I)/ActR/RegA family two-component response regulator